MDNVLVDFPSGIEKISPELQAEYEGDMDDVPGIFALMDPMPGAIQAFNKLAKVYDTYILSTALCAFLRQMNGSNCFCRFCIARRIKIIRKAMLKVRDRRVKVTTELLKAIVPDLNDVNVHYEDVNMGYLQKTCRADMRSARHVTHYYHHL